MDELDSYYEYIEKIARIKKWELIDLAFFFKDELQTNNQLIDSIIPTRQVLISEYDRNGVFFYLQNNILEGER